MPFYTYILYSDSKDRYYIGSCENLEIRLLRHNAGATPSTKPGRPWKIVWFVQYNTKSEAIRHELLIKKMKSRVYIKKLIQDSEDSSVG